MYVIILLLNAFAVVDNKIILANNSTLPAVLALAGLSPG